jgi:hypothetical protein
VAEVEEPSFSDKCDDQELNEPNPAEPAPARVKHDVAAQLRLEPVGYANAVGIYNRCKAVYERWG